MSQTQIAIDYSTKEIESYIDLIMASSRDEIDILRTKMEIHKTILNALNEYSISNKNEKFYNKIETMLKGLKKIKGISSVDLIFEKVNVLIDHIAFINITF